MGLRLVAHYFDLCDALIAQSVVDAAGIPAFLHGFDMLSVQPQYTMGIGGYRLVVDETDLEAAVAVLREAVSRPLDEGERLKVTVTLMDRILSPLLGWFSGGVAMPLRQCDWMD